MIDPIINKIWDETRLVTGIKACYLTFAKQDDIVDHGYPFMTIVRNDWSDMDHKDAVIPNKSYEMIGNIMLDFFSDELLTLTVKYPQWRHTFITETRPVSYDASGLKEGSDYIITLDSMKLTSSGRRVDRRKDDNLYILSLSAEYAATIKYK